MVSFVIRCKFAPEDRDEMAATAAALGRESRREPGCINYIVHQLQDDPNTILFYEQYTNAAALQAHEASPHFQKYSVGVLSKKIKSQHREDLIALD